MQEIEGNFVLKKELEVRKGKLITKTFSNIRRGKQRSKGGTGGSVK